MIVPLGKDFDFHKWEKGTRDEITEELTDLAEARYDAGLGEFSKVLMTQAQLAGATLEQMRESRDSLQRCVYTWVRKHLGDALTPELEQTPLSDMPADYREAIEKGFFDGIRLFRDRQVMIQTVDQHWVKHLTDLDELREGIGLRAYAQRDPLVSYRTEASRTYEEMLASIGEQVSHRVFNVQFSSQGQQPQRRQQQQQSQQQRAAPVAVGGKSALDRAIERGALKTSGGSVAAAGDGKPKPSNTQKYGRNDTCPFCNSGKKLKHCDCEGARKWRGEL